jgi:hypothetical protein
MGGGSTCGGAQMQTGSTESWPSSSLVWPCLELSFSVVAALRPGEEIAEAGLPCLCGGRAALRSGWRRGCVRTRRERGTGVPWVWIDDLGFSRVPPVSGCIPPLSHFFYFLENRKLPDTYGRHIFGYPEVSPYPDVSNPR